MTTNERFLCKYGRHPRRQKELILDAIDVILNRLSAILIVYYLQLVVCDVGRT